MSMRYARESEVGLHVFCHRARDLPRRTLLDQAGFHVVRLDHGLVARQDAAAFPVCDLAAGMVYPRQPVVREQAGLLVDDAVRGISWSAADRTR